MKLALIGCGKMGGALVRGLVQRGVLAPADVTACDAVPAAVEALQTALPGVQAAGGAAAAAAGADVVLLCVKPGDLAGVVTALRGHGGLLLSIAAGISLAQLEGWAGPGVRVIRAMPNTPALVGAGASAYALGTAATGADGKTADQLLGAVGLVSAVPEKLLDAVTGLSGSGPAYIYTVIEALAEGGVLMGLPVAQAMTLAAQTVAGAAQLVLQTGEHPAALKHQVTSPGGTTIAGLAVLERAGLRAALIDAVAAATRRAQELGAAAK